MTALNARGVVTQAAVHLTKRDHGNMLQGSRGLNLFMGGEKFGRLVICPPTLREMSPAQSFV